jgi:hypothetical protein
MTDAKQASARDSGLLLNDSLSVGSDQSNSESDSRVQAQSRGADAAASAKIWRDVFKVHAAANLFPMMPRAELLVLGEDSAAPKEAPPQGLGDG